MDKKREPIESYPISAEVSAIKKEYFHIFYVEFSQRILEVLPTAVSVFLLGDEEEAKGCLSETQLSLWHQLIAGESFCAIDSGVLLFALPGEESPVVSVSGADPLFLQRLDSAWLQETSYRLIRDFSLICSGNIDNTSGLPNLGRLQFLLDNWPEKGGFLALVELPVKHRTLRRKYRYTQFCSRALQNFVHNPACVHYLAQDTFALILPCSEEKGRQTFAGFENSLIAFLKKEGCFRVHIGSALWLAEEEEAGSASVLLDRAWSALQAAEKRGPFSFCSYEHLAYPEQSRLAPVASSLQIRLRRLWQPCSRFSLLLIKADSSEELPLRIKEQLAENDALICHDNEFYLFFAGDDGRVAQQQIEHLVTLSKKYEEGTVSGGIAIYPYANFKKSEMVMNCKKALIHASFFGAGSFATFDSTSLNISGDIYFGQGDFTKAIFEYRRGIFCSKEKKGEVNLYNSLGVTLALMNRLKPALESFSAALSLKPHNFMALYNSGLALKDMGQKEQAFSQLQQAYRYAQKEDAAVLHDIELYLGILGVETQQMAAAVDYLLRWLKGCEQKKESGKVYRYLGQAYYGVGEQEKAIECLQKALHYDQFDAQALSLLGYLYLISGEGEDVAQTLCRKSVELEPENPALLLPLAETLIVCGNYAEGQGLLQRCQRSKQLRYRSWLLLGELHLQQGKKGIAKRYFSKLSHRQGLSPDIKRRLQQGLNALL